MRKPAKYLNWRVVWEAGTFQLCRWRKLAVWKEGCVWCLQELLLYLVWCLQCWLCSLMSVYFQHMRNQQQTQSLCRSLFLEPSMEIGVGIPFGAVVARLAVKDRRPGSGPALIHRLSLGDVSVKGQTDKFRHVWSLSNALFMEVGAVGEAVRRHAEEVFR